MNSISVFDAYLSDFPKDLHPLFSKVFHILSQEIPGGKACIKYGIPTLMKDGKNIIHIGLFKKHLGIYPGPAAIAHHQAELASFKCTKGAIQFPYEMEIPENLIKSIVRYNLKILLK